MGARSIFGQIRAISSIQVLPFRPILTFTQLKLSDCQAPLVYIFVFVQFLPLTIILLGVIVQNLRVTHLPLPLFPSSLPRSCFVVLSFRIYDIAWFSIVFTAKSGAVGKPRKAAVSQ